MEPIEIFIIDDHPMFMNGIAKSFSKTSDNIYVGGSAKSAGVAREKLKDSQADVILLDLKMPFENGVDFSLEIKRDYPDKKIIVLTGETDEQLLYNVWLNGVDAIIMKATGKKQLISAIEAVMQGERKIGADVPPFFEYHIRHDDKPFLTRREQQVMNLLVSGFHRKEVAEKLDISIDTVNKHCTNVFRKYGVDSLQKFVQKSQIN